MKIHPVRVEFFYADRYRDRQTDRRRDRERERRKGRKRERDMLKKFHFFTILRKVLKRFVISWSISKILHAGSHKVPDTPALCLPHIWCFYLATVKFSYRQGLGHACLKIKTHTGHFGDVYSKEENNIKMDLK